MSQRAEETHAHEARREAASVAVCSSAVLTLLALVSWREGWEVVSFPWWTWLVLAIPGLVLCVDLWLGTGGLGARGRNSALVLLGLIVAGNVAGLALLISSLVTTRSADIGGGQLLLTAARDLGRNIIAFGRLVLGGRGRRPGRPRAQRDGGRRTSASRRTRTGARTMQAVASPHLGLPLRLPDGASAFSPTDAMPMTLPRKGSASGIESTVSRSSSSSSTARAVNVLGS